MANSITPAGECGNTLLGCARIVRAAYEGRDLAALCGPLQMRVAADPDDAAALMDLSLVLEVAGQRDAALACQTQALALSRAYRIVNGRGDGLRVAVFKAAGDLMANTPIELLLEHSDTVVQLCFVDAAAPVPVEVPEHDVAFLAIGESEANAAVLAAIEPRLRGWCRPVMNGHADQIRGLTRTGVAARLREDGPVQASGVCAPGVVVLDRAVLQLLAGAADGLHSVLAGAAFPAIVRPVGSHAGAGLQKVDRQSELATYLEEQAGERFYVTEFVDYAGRDGLYRKYRIALIDGQPFASHMAISAHWMVHYLNADMETNASRRAEEAAWMATFDTAFAVRHAVAFRVLAEAIGLDYFAIDCAETMDGRLLLFEADVAMIVHALDPASLFPYKKPVMAKLFAAFEAALQRRASEAEPGLRFA